MSVTFPDAPGGPQDYEMEEEALMEAIKCNAQIKADTCKITKDPRKDDCQLPKLGIAISPNVLSLSTPENNTTTFSFVYPRYRCCIAIFCCSTTSLASIPNNYSLLRISTWCRNCVN
jgi:hypothetical protein